MKIRKTTLAAVAAIIIFPAALAVWAATDSTSATPTSGGTIKEQLNALVAQINKKLQLGSTTKEQLAGEMKQFDAILAAHPDDKSNDAAEVLVAEGQLYDMVLNDPASALAAFQRLQKDFPNTQLAKAVEPVIAGLQKEAEAEAIHKQLVVGSVFPDFSVTGLDGKTLSPSQYKGKVLLVDFWATWCGPCMVEVPDVVDVYNKYNAAGFSIIGISLDEDKQELNTVMGDRKMTWPEFFDGKKWDNQLAVKYGIKAIPANFLLDGDGKIIAVDLRGDALGAAVAKALGK